MKEFVTGRYSPRALVEAIRAEEREQEAISRSFPPGSETAQWHKAVSAGFSVAADIVENFFATQDFEEVSQ